MKNKILTATMLLVSVTSSMAQTTNDYSDESVLFRLEPSAPSASSLGRYGTHQVVLNNGLTPINIPLYEIQCGDLKVPIQLCYHGGGIKVEQEATWVGLGWDLDFGGSIVRTVYGSDDKLERLDSVPSASYISNNILYNNNNFLYCNDLATGRENKTYQPDLYSYKIGDKSGTFFTKGRTGTGGFDFDSIFTTSCQKIKIANRQFITKGLVMDDGTLYEFNQTETTTTTTPRRDIDPYISAFYVTKILSPTGKDTIRYTYQGSGWSKISHSQCYTGFKHIENHYVTQWSPTAQWTERPYQNYRVPKTCTDYYIPEVQTVKPQYIYFRGGRLKFNLEDRNDGLCVTSHKLKRLSSIEVQEKMSNGQYQTRKTITFHYSYYQGNQGYKKLRLDSVTEEGIAVSNTTSKLIASFTYYGQNANLPSRNSTSKDFWGFYNGKANGESIFPYTVLTGANGPELVGDADRTPDEQYMKYYSLKSVTYPTGGRTEYDWEINRVNLPTPLYGKMKSCSLSYRPSHVHSTGPTPFEDESSVTIYSYQAQSVQMSISITKDTINFNHNKYDRCGIYLDGVEVAGYAGTNTTYNTTKIVYLSQGNHTITIQCNCKNMSGSFSLNYWGRDGIEDNNVPFAGLRICKITDFDTDGTVLTCRKYDYTAPNGQSSGYLLTNDENISFCLNSVTATASTENGVTYLTAINWNLVFSDMKRGPRENDYAYEYVTEHIMDGNTILSSTRYKYDKRQDGYVAACTPLIDKSCFRNNIVMKEEFDHQSHLLRRTRNYYHQDNRITSNATGFVMHTNHVFSSQGAFTYYCSRYGVGLQHLYVPYNYTLNCNWIHPDSTIVTEFLGDGTTGDSIMRKTIYTYGNGSHVHLQPTQVAQIAGNDQYITAMTYPSDFTGSPYSTMVAKNMLTYPVDMREYSIANGGSMLLCGGLHHQYTHNDTILTLTQVSRILPNNNTERLYDYTYNNCGRLVEFADQNHVLTSIKWDANNVYPLYMAKGISHGTLNNLPTPGSPTSHPTMSVSSYTYQPLVGVKTWMAPYGLTKRFEYDGLGRLIQEYFKTLNSNTLHLLRDYEYNYAN